MIPDDPIVSEVRKAGADYLARFNYDLRAAMADLRERTRQSGRKVVSLPPKKIASPGAATKKAS
jgi:hypothetical protein